MKFLKNKMSETQTYLTIFFVVTLLVSNIISAKQVQLPFGITMTAAIIVFPITYILSDVFSECYGYRWSRITCYLGFLMNLFMVIVFELAITTPAPSYWGNQDAFQVVLGSAPRMLFASLLAFIMGDLVNDKVFRTMKAKHEDLTGFGSRAILSSLCGEIVDSAIFLPLAFIGQMPANTLFVMAITQVSLKVAYEIIIFPVTRLVAKKVKEIEDEVERSDLS